MCDSQSDTESSDEPESSCRTKRQKTSRSCRAGLIFPVSRIDRFLRRGDYAERIGSGASVYMAAVLQYLTYDIVDIAGNIASGDDKRRIVPEHLQQAISNDTELHSLLGGISFPNVKDVPKNHPAPSAKRSRGKKPNKDVKAPNEVTT